MTTKTFKNLSEVKNLTETERLLHREIRKTSSLGGVRAIMRGLGNRDLPADAVQRLNEHGELKRAWLSRRTRPDQYFAIYGEMQKFKFCSVR